jgi:hypothetical protein
LSVPVAPTAFARLDRRGAWIRLGTIAAAMTVFVAAAVVGPRKSRIAEGTAQGRDIALYLAEIERVRRGESYYAAAAEELRSRGYPTKSVFNWRTPLPTCLIAALPHPAAGKVVLGGLVAAALWLALVALSGESGVRRALGGTLLLAGALLFTVLGDSFVMSELWAAALLSMSLACYGLNRPAWGALCGIAALFFRELAGPYCFVAALLAASGRRRGETALWLAGLAAYGAYFAWHAARVAAWQTPDDLAHDGSWLQFGGAPFLVALAQINAYLILLPSWTAAAYLVLGLVGLAGWNGAWGRRLAWTTAAYLLLFACVGYDFNQYWGAILAPMLCFGAAQAPAALVDLARAVRGPGPRLAPPPAYWPEPARSTSSAQR